MSDLAAVLAHIDADLDNALTRLFELLRIRSISTDPAFATECRTAAAWLADDLASMGFSASVRDTAGHPNVIGHRRDEGEGPAVLFYGHYDVQPVDPLELWEQDPFSPSMRTRDDGTMEIRARGAADDKGQLMTFLEACRAWRTVTGRLPVPVSVLLEGEEETGSPSLDAFLAEHAAELSADVGLVCDTNMWDGETPAITTMLRGLAGIEFTVEAADRDLHSGFFGSAAANPNHVVARILADLHDEGGRVALPGFYDGVAEPSPALRAAWDGLDFDPARFLGEVGLSLPAGEKGRSALEMIWSRPTAEVNGMAGGYAGAGFKTVIPAAASAKVSFRLVGEQDPAAILEAFRAFVAARVPADCRVSFIEHAASRAVAFDHQSPAVSAAARALAQEWERPAAFVGAGVSIPACAAFRHGLGMEAILVGFGREDDRVHSPNEKYDLKSFHKGIRSWARILAALGA